LTRLTLSLYIDRCRHIGCNRSAGSFGVCSEHEAADINKHFMRAVELGLVEYETPQCFRSEGEYREYVVTVLLSGGYKSRGKADPINFCRDCIPKYKEQMMAAHRCQHPETVFVLEQGRDEIGVPLLNPKSPRAWEQAVMGMAGPVVVMPPEHIVGKTIDMLNERRPVGRPKKGGDE